MTKSERKGDALYYDSLPIMEEQMSKYLNFNFDADAPMEISFEILLRENNFLVLCPRKGFDDDKDILKRALAKGTDYDFDGRTLKLYTAYLRTLPRGRYSVFSAVFDRGQSIVFSIWSEAEAGALANETSLEVMDFGKFNDGDIKKDFKPEYFSSAKLTEEEGEINERLVGKVLTLSYDFSLKPRSVTAYFQSRARGIIQMKNPRAMMMWVHGDNSQNVLSMRLYNRSRATVNTENEIKINWSGWKQVYFSLPREVALPLANWEVVRLIRTEDGAPTGELKIAKICVTSQEVSKQDSMYIKTLPPTWESGPIVFDFHGIVKGAETLFKAQGANGYEPKAPLVLKCTGARDKKGKPLDFEMPELVFDERGEIASRIFTDPAFRGDAIFALRAVDANGASSDIKTLVSAPQDPSYTPLPTRIIRNITADPKTSVAFSYVTNTDTQESYLKIRKEGEKEELVVQSTVHYGREARESVSLFDTAVTLDREYLAHSVDISGLSPGSTYLCSLGSDGAWTKPFAIKTLSAKEGSFGAVLLPDAQCGHSTYYQKALCELVQNAKARAGDDVFVIALGDLINTATDLVEYEEVIGRCQKEFMTHAFAPTPGNHERDIHRRFANYVSHWNTPPCSLSEYRNLMYEFFVEDYHFISLPVGDELVAPEIINWFESTLAASRSKWKVVIMHSPPYGAKSLESCARNALVPIMDKYDVDLCLSAHEHIYVRSSMRRGERVETGQGVLYLTLGTAGPKAYEGCANPWQDYVYGDKYEERYFGKRTDRTNAVAKFSPSCLEVDVAMTSGRVVDRIRLQK